MRSGVDPKDGDSVAFTFEDPATIDPSELSVLVVGEGASCSYAGMTCHKWDEVRGHASDPRVHGGGPALVSWLGTLTH